MNRPPIAFVIVKRISCFLLAFLSLSAALHAQTDVPVKYRLTPTPDPTSKSRVYVPANLDDAFRELRKMLHPDLQKEMKNHPEEDMARYHHGLGTWMRNNWGLWRGSRLARYFNTLGIRHPDDMSGIVLRSFWRHLNAKPIRLDEQVAYYKRYWQAAATPRGKRCPLDGTTIEIDRTLIESAGKKPRSIHTGRCAKRHPWAYEFDKGWYRPDRALRKRIREWSASGR